MRTSTLAGVAALASIAAATLFSVFVRSTEALPAVGTIVAASLEQPRTSPRLNASPRREDWSVSERKIPESYRFIIKLDHPQAEVRYLLEKVAGERFQPGDRVTITYEERGVPPLWTKRYVRSMALAATK